MGSSSKKKGTATGQKAGAPAAPPQMASQSYAPELGGPVDYFANPAQLPAGGGLVRPPSAPGLMQGAGLNFMMPPPPPAPPPRAQLANVMTSGQTTPMGNQGPTGGLYNNNAGARSYRGGRNSR